AKTVEPGFRHAANLQKVLDLAMETEAERRELGAVHAQRSNNHAFG
ncbi:UNVERIFIED_ORG: hypothetical protein J2W85_006381, partial [Ensifer adhaerens]|nr:hypothetical protein [Ensifer adhaerens]